MLTERRTVVQMSLISILEQKFWMKYLGLISLIVFLAKLYTIVRLNRRHCLTVVSDAWAVCFNVKLVKYKAV